eukprot:14424004-Alexandrium_andersonii.AAC.1
MAPLDMLRSRHVWSTLSQDQQRQMTDLVQIATQQVDVLFRSKFNFWLQLPWRLCAASHWGPAVAARASQQ